MVTWGDKTTLGSQTAIDSVTEEFLPSAGGSVDLAAGLQAHIQLQVDNDQTSITNGLTVSVYTSLDDSSEDWDELPFMQFDVVPSTTGAEDVTFVVSGVYNFRIGLLASAVTDDYDASGNYRVRTA